MSDNQIKISVNLDSKELDQKFSGIIKKLQQIREEASKAGAAVDKATGGISSGQSRAGGGAGQAVNANQSNKSLEALQTTLKTVSDRTDTFNKNLSTLAKTLDDLSNKAQSAATATNQAATAQQTTQQQTTGGGGPTTPQTPTTPTTPGGPGGGGGANLLQTLTGRIGSGLTGAGSVMAAYGSFQGFRAGLPGREAERDVGIARSTGELRERAIRGQSFEDIAFAPERARAVKRSMDFFKETQDAREYRATGKALGMVGTGAGMLYGAYKGGMTGLALGGIPGTVIGAGIGAGAAYVAGKGLGFTDEEAYYGLTRNKKALAKMTGKEAMQEQEKYYLQEIMKDPYKYSQTKFLGENRELLSRVQKSTGLSDTGMYGEGGFVQRGADKFLFGERAAMQQQIVGAGGAVSGQSNVHLMALQAQRNLGLTNSGQAMGRLTSYLKPNETEDAFVKILAKGFSVGLDNSDYREESKDYLAQVTAIASRMGGGQEMVAERIAAGMGGDLSRRSVEKSAEAFQSLTQYQEETGGIIGATKFRLINEDPFLSKLKGTSRLGLQRLKRSDIEQGEKNPVMQEYLSQIEEGMTPEQKKEFGGMAGLQKRLGNVFDKGTFGALEQGKDIEKLIEQARTEKDPAKRKQLVGKAATMAYGMEFGQSAEDAYRMMAQRVGITEEKPAPEQPTMMDKVRSFFGAPTEGIEKTKQAEAKAQSEQFKGMQQNFENIFKNAMENAGGRLADQLIMEEFNKKLGEGAKALEVFIKAYGDVINKTNPLPSGNSGQDAAIIRGKEKKPVGSKDG